MTRGLDRALGACRALEAPHNLPHMASRAPQRMTIAEFLEWSDGTDRRYQLVDGVPVMMAPTLEAHGELAINIGAESPAV